MIHVIKEQRPDLLCMQEATQGQTKDIMNAKALADTQYDYAVIAAEDSREQNPILYRKDMFKLSGHGVFWLSDTPDRPSKSKDWGNKLVRKCVWGRFVDKKTEKAFYVYNTHLSHMSQTSRDKSVRLIAERIGGRTHPEPFILTGDFNNAENSGPVTYLKGKPLQAADSFRVVHPDAKNARTAHGFKGGMQGNKIDYVFTSRKIEVLKAAIIRTAVDGKYPSDHYPVTACLRIP